MGYSRDEIEKQIACPRAATRSGTGTLDWLVTLDGGRYRFCEQLSLRVCVATDRDGTELVIKQHAMAGLDGIPTYDDPATEIELHSRLKHPRLAEFVRAYPQDHVLVTRRVPGKSMALRYFLAPASDIEVADMLIAVAEAVAYLHDQGVIHRDIIPRNVVCHHNSATLVDLGAAVKLGPEPAARIFEMTVMTDGLAEHIPWARPPEEAYGPQADVYYLGLLGFFMLTGTPYLDFSNSLLQKDSSYVFPWWWLCTSRSQGALVAILKCALNESPTDRFPTGQEMLRVLRMYRATIGRSVDQAS